MPCALPENAMFIPALLVEVYDTRPIKDVLVGTTSIPLSTFAPWVTPDKRAPFKYVVDVPPFRPPHLLPAPPLTANSLNFIPLPSLSSLARCSPSLI